MSNITILHSAESVFLTEEDATTGIAIDEVGYICALGSSEKLKEKYLGAREFDLQGATVLPAFWDCHTHPFGTGEKVLSPDLSTAGSIAEVIELLKPLQSENSDDWIIARGWDQTKWIDKNFPDFRSLDCFSQPVSLTRIDGHALWCNSACLKKCRINQATVDPLGGEILRDMDGQPTGIFIDEAMKLINRHWPPVTTDKMKMILETGLRHFFEHGIVGVHDMGVSEELWEVYKDLYATHGDQLPYANVFLDMIIYPSGKELFLKKCESGVFSDSPHERLRLIGIKLYFDGALGSRGAKLLQSYSDAENHDGLDLMEDEEEVAELVSLAVARDLQVAIHAIGDAACRRALDTFEKARQQYPNSSSILRIEHSQIVTPEDLSRFRSLGVCAIVQPAFYFSDHVWAAERLGKDRMRNAYRWRSFLENNIFVVASSDAPIETASVLHGMGVLAHSDRSESISTEAAMELYSKNAVKLFQNKDLGVIEVGKKANFTLVKMADDGLPSQVLGYVIDGRVCLF